MIGGGANWRGEQKLTALHVYVDDVDTSYQRAVAAGAKAMSAPIEAHGERVASVQDVAGNEWYLAKRYRLPHRRRIAECNVYLHPLARKNDRLSETQFWRRGDHDLARRRMVPCCTQR